MVFRVPLKMNTSTRKELDAMFSFTDESSASPMGAFLAGDAHFLPTNHCTIIEVVRPVYNDAGGKRGAREQEPNSAHVENGKAGVGADAYYMEK